MGIRENEVIGQVRHALARDPKLDAPRINITMIGESLALTGILDSPEEVTRAEQIARSAAPGVEIDNSLTVSLHQDGGTAYGNAGGNRHHAWKDSELQQAAEREVAACYDQLSGKQGNVGVEVINGIAHLQGATATAKDRQLLIEAVGRVAGLRRVIADSLDVAPFGTADDSRLGSLALEKLQQLAPGLSAYVTIDVRNRGAHLIGSVRTAEDRTRAEDVVMQVPGIQLVHNELRLYQDESSEDLNVQIEQEVRHAIGRAGLPVVNIRVFYTPGVLGLDGEVETPEQRQQAIMVANDVLHRMVGEQYQIIHNLKINARRGHEPMKESRMIQHQNKVTNEPVIPVSPEHGQSRAHTPPIEERRPTYE